MTERGPICQRCEQAESWRQADRQATGAGKGPFGLGPLGWGLVSIFFNFFMIPSILAISGGIQDLRVTGAARNTYGLGPAERSIRTNAIVGIVLGCLHPLFLVFAVGVAVLAVLASPPSDPSYYGSDYDDPYLGSLPPPPAWDDPGDPGSYGGAGLDLPPPSLPQPGACVDLGAGAFAIPGDLGVFAPTWARPDGEACPASPEVGAFPFAAFAFCNRSSVARTVDVVATGVAGPTTQALRDPFLVVYEGAVPPDVRACRAINDDDGGSHDAGLRGLVVAPGSTLVVVVTSFYEIERFEAADDVARGHFVLQVAPRS